VSGFTLRSSHGRPPKSGLDARPGAIANRHVELRESDTGQVDLHDRETGERYADVLRLVDEPDIGDTYTPQVDESRAVPARFGASALLAAGPLVAAICSPFCILSPGGGTITGRRMMIMHADSPVVRVRFELDNRSGNHRLRMQVPVGVGDTAIAGNAFGFEVRAVADSVASPLGAERPVRTAPAHRHVGAANGTRGLVALAPGFFEYEWTAHRNLLVTLLRSVGELSRADLPDRPGHAGWPTTTPDAQEPGSHVVELAMVPVTDAELNRPDVIERWWEDAFLPPQATFVPDFTGTPTTILTPGLTLEGDGLVFSAIKPAERGHGIVVRCYNCEPAPVSGRWITGSPISAAMLMRADESTVRELNVIDRRVVEFVAPVRGIITILLEPEAA
jgi:alpha-mannosidase